MKRAATTPLSAAVASSALNTYMFLASPDCEIYNTYDMEVPLDGERILTQIACVV